MRGRSFTSHRMLSLAVQVILLNTEVAVLV